jgi:hypothetical protein
MVQQTGFSPGEVEAAVDDLTAEGLVRKDDGVFQIAD